MIFEVKVFEGKVKMVQSKKHLKSKVKTFEVPSGEEIVNYSLESLVFAFKNSSSGCFYTWYILIFATGVLSFFLYSRYLFALCGILSIIGLIKYSSWDNILKRLLKDVKEYYPEKASNKEYYWGYLKGLKEVQDERFFVGLLSCILVIFMNGFRG